MPPRFFVDQTLAAPGELSLPPAAARHVQVLRLQPGNALTLFDGSATSGRPRCWRWGAARSACTSPRAKRVQRELGQDLTLALVMPANDRMDSLVEKATELGVTGLQPLMSERSVLRLAGERAQKKLAHWHGVAVAACEQSGAPGFRTSPRCKTWQAGCSRSTFGRDSDIRLDTHTPEFVDWRWAALETAPDLVIPFKRPVYEEVAQRFKKFTVGA